MPALQSDLISSAGISILLPGQLDLTQPTQSCSWWMDYLEKTLAVLLTATSVSVHPFLARRLLQME